jgi:PASTA domain
LGLAGSATSRLATVPDTCVVSSYDDYESAGPRGWSPFAVSAIALLVLLLGAGGAVFGIYVANKNATSSLGPGPLSTPTPGPTGPTSGPTPTPTPTPTAAGTPTPTPTPDSFALPDLSRMDFQAARQAVRNLNLGWQLIFEGTEGPDTVRATDPAAGATVHKGLTVHIYVTGPAPLAQVPDVQGKECIDAAAAIVDAGLYPDYGTTGKQGPVTSQTPLASDPPKLHWNDIVHIVCGPAAA